MVVGVCESVVRTSPCVVRVSVWCVMVVHAVSCLVVLCCGLWNGGV